MFFKQNGKTGDPLFGKVRGDSSVPSFTCRFPRRRRDPLIFLFLFSRFMFSCANSHRLRTDKPIYEAVDSLLTILTSLKLGREQEKLGRRKFKDTSQLIFVGPTPSYLSIFFSFSRPGLRSVRNR